MKQRRGSRAQAGYTVIELTVALSLAFIVVLALGRLMLVNQTSWRQGQARAVLQQNVTETLEHIARQVRRAHSVEISQSALRVLDEDGDVIHSYRRDGYGEAARLEEDGDALTPQICTQFDCDVDDSESTATVSLELANADGSRVAGLIRATVRNRNLVF